MLEHRLGDEGKRSLRADHEPAEHLQRRVGVEQRAQPITGRVLDLELAADPSGEGLVGAELVAERLEAGGELGRRGGEGGLGVGRGGVDHGAVREHERHRAHRPVGVGAHPAAHSAGVVGDHAADAGDVGAGRVRAELAPVAGEQAVDVPEDDAGLSADARASILDPRASPVAADVDEDRVGLRSGR